MLDLDLSNEVSWGRKTQKIRLGGPTRMRVELDRSWKRRN